jgi:alpha-L-arabinofuranosidase
LTTSDAKNAVVGNVGVGTWGTQAEYKDFKVVDKDGKELYASDFTKGADSTTGWTTEAGRWSIIDGAYHQGSNQNAFAYLGDEKWSDYTITLKARKVAGGEGFLVIFGHKGNDRYWWNIGAYGNTRHEIEMNQAVQGRAVNGAIETNRWYDLKVEVSGLHVRTWMDGQLVNDVQVQPPAGSLSVISGRDDQTGEIIIKAINRAATPQTANLQLAGVASIDTKARATTLSSARLADNNSLDNPLAVIPHDKDFTVAGPKFDYEFPAYSFTVLRIKATR